MAEKKANIVSRTLVESYVRKQVKELKQSPEQTINTLTSQLLETPNNSLEKYLVHITPEKLHDTQSGYYQLFHDILPKISTEHLVTLGMNIGYHSLFTTAKNGKKNIPESTSNALWASILFIDGPNYEKKSTQYKAQISQSKKNGTHCFLLFIEKYAWKLLPLIQKEKDCAFILFCPASCLTDKFLDVAKRTKNLLLSVAYNKSLSSDIFNKLKARNLPYAVHYYYSTSDVDSIISGEIFEELSKKTPLFSFFIPQNTILEDKSITNNTKKIIYEAIVQERYWLKSPSIPFEINEDIKKIEQIKNHH